MTTLDTESELRACETPAQIERLFQRVLKRTQRGNAVEILRQLCNTRAQEIAGRCRRGHLLATRTDKGRGNSARYVVDGEAYRTGIWGNGAGYRWVMAAWEVWYAGKLRTGGLRSRAKIESVIGRVRDGYLWRALQVLAGRDKPKPQQEHAP